ncbi:MAG: copper homeostasis protein CutC [Firmicutes bacterium]|nr:copper homeostasis protein CutC [Bacillota bacterium]
MSYTVEVCCYTIEDVWRAEQAGATRIELCADRPAGGTTPSYGLIEHVLATVAIDVAVMIRPRGGGFLYSDDELMIMQRDISMAGRLGVEGVVFGVLDAEGFLDVPKMQTLVDTAKQNKLMVTCHRAFDQAQDPHRTLEELINLGVDRLLTSGQKPTSIEGLPLLKELSEIAGDQLVIMSGGSVRSSNIDAILAAGIRHIHTGSAQIIQSQMLTGQPGLSMGGPTYDEDIQMIINQKDVADIVKAVKRKAGQSQEENG